MNEKTKIIFVALTFLITGIVIGFFLNNFLKINNTPQTNNNINIVDQISKCLDIFNKKKERYLNTATIRHDVIFNEKLDTCLAFIQSFIQGKINTDDFGVYDILKDKTLLFYSDEKEGFSYSNSNNPEKCKYSSLFLMYWENGEKVIKEGCERWDLTDEMSEKVNNFGFSFP